MQHAVSINLLFLLALLASQTGSVNGALQHRPVSSFPIDTYASPKYDISFLNDRPIGRQEADLWRQGIRRRGEAAFDAALPTPRGETEEQDGSGADLDAITWQSLFAGTVSIRDQKGDDLISALWSDPLSRSQHRLKDGDYPSFVPLKLPSVPRSDSDRPNLSDLTRPNVTRPSEVHDYLCALPVVGKPSAAIQGNHTAEKQNTDQEVVLDALEVYRHLDPLDGACLYHRQGWFTYAYCHNSHIRQFREAASPAAIAASKPVEDVTFEAYDLGVSPLSLEQRLDEYRILFEDAEAEGIVSKTFIPDPDDPTQEIEVVLETETTFGLQIQEMEGILARNYREQKSADHTDTPSATTDEKIVKHSLSIHSNAQAKYLVEVWEGGTICDMTGKARRIEIEFHCGSDGPDGIVGVKEISTCQYIMTIKTPRICNIPGFYVPSASLGPTHQIQCRRIAQDNDVHALTAGQDLSEGDISKDGGRAPSGWNMQRRLYRTPVQRSPPAVKDLGVPGEVENEVIIPGVDGRPPQRITKPPKLRRKQNPGKAAHTTEADKAALAEQRKKKAAARERKAERTSLQQEIRRSVDEDWETYYFVRLARWVGYYKKGGAREQKDKRFLYETLEEEVRRLQAEEDAQRKKMET